MGPALNALTPKGAHYHAKLGAALVRGAWAEANPGTTPNGAPLSWTELIRKWGKHTGGNTDLIHTVRNVSLSYLSSSYVIPYAPEERLAQSREGAVAAGNMSGAGSSSSYVHVSSKPAAHLSDGDLDGPDGAGPDAWSTHGLWGWVVDPQHAPDVRQGLKTLETMRNSAPGKDQPTIALTMAYQTMALGDFDAALSLLEAFNWASKPDFGAVDGDAAVTERIRARVIQGMCYEMSGRPDLNKAVQCYLDAVAMTESLTSSPLIMPTYLLASGNAPKAAIPNFEAQREILRWISLGLTRSAVISAHSGETKNTVTLRILRTYHALSVNWAPNFRARQRQRMLDLYIAALETSYPSAGEKAPEPYLLAGTAPPGTARVMWRQEVAEALRCGQRLLGETTVFPRAGAYNVAVVNFANRAAQFPTLSQALAGDSVNVLWWATTLTYQSQSVLRNLGRLLEVIGDLKSARRVFELYVKLVLKARETEDPDNPLTLQRHPTETDEQEAEEIKTVEGGVNQGQLQDGHEAPHGSDKETGDVDTDDQFVQGLNTGALMLLRRFHDSAEAWRYATLASDVTKRGAVSPKVVSEAEEVKGIIRLGMSNSGEAVGSASLTMSEHTKRKQLQVQAINHLKAATTLDPSSVSALYHLAYAYAVSRQIDPALDNVRRALELDSSAVRCWHLLALLMTATGDWQAGRKAAETGVSLWETDDEAAIADEGDMAFDGQTQRAPHILLLPNGDLTPVPTIPDARPSKDERLSAILQLRMTLNTIVEKLDGPEAALVRQQELFRFFSSRTDPQHRGPGQSSGVHGPAMSISGTMSSRRGERPTSMDLGGSYVLTPPNDVHVSPPSPQLAAAPATSPPSPTPGTPNSSAAESMGAVSDIEGRMHKRSLLPKHLHVPSVARAHRDSKLVVGKGVPADVRSLKDQRTASASSLSIAPTAIHSHYHFRQARAAPPPPPARERSGRSPAEERMLADLWLQSAATFRRSGKLEQSLVAVEEAEAGDPANPAIWVQLGLLHEAEGRSGGRSLTAPSRASNGTAAPGPTPNTTNGDAPALPRSSADALASYTKALLLRPDYPSSLVNIAKLQAADGDYDNANSLLSQLVQDQGWDCPEAWYLLGSIAEKQQRREKSREFLRKALELQQTRCCRGLGEALGVW